MTYVVWIALGVLIALLAGARRHRALQPSAAALFAGAFGALIGGVVGGRVLGDGANKTSLAGLVGAVGGALLLCWAARDRTSDVEP
jgi:uncharacterized membrane protein YeaQ/YmgE (transglycosylase-associated protein family)